MIHQSAITAADIATAPQAPALEIRFRAAEIRALFRSTDPADFRAEAMYLIDASLFTADAGSCAAAADRTDPETGERELCVGVTARDPEAAEQIIRSTVRGTSYDRIAAIVRLSADPATA